MYVNKYSSVCSVTPPSTSGFPVLLHSNSITVPLILRKKNKNTYSVIQHKVVTHLIPYILFVRYMYPVSIFLTLHMYKIKAVQGGKYKSVI